MAESPLQRYREKRKPAETPEPFGGTLAAPVIAGAAAGRFVVQQHAARRMHWDLRLEINGVLASWAVPRGPSRDPKEKRLAVRTEDHPLEYADFEGIIPAGNYGAGAMIVWDRGAFHTAKGEPAADGVGQGKLDVIFTGHKLQGRWELVRMKGEDGRNWLLLKKAEGVVTGPEIVVSQPASVLSGLTIDEMRAGTRRTDELAQQAVAAGAIAQAVDATKVRPMLAETADHPFSKPGWIFELKYDGVRVLASRDRHNVAHLRYRTGRDTTHLFPEIARAVARIPCDDVIIDGEIVALDERGVSSFERLQRRLGLSDPAAVARAEVEVPVVMVCFDLLAAAGYDLRGLPLITRKALLQRLVPPAGYLRFASHLDTDGAALFEEVCNRGLEGVVGKRAASVYQSGRRSRDWLKIKALRTADLAVVGYVRGKGARAALGALMLAWRRDGELVYAGNVGTGFDAELLRRLDEPLRAARRPTPAFRGTPPGAVRNQVFVDPQLVAEVRYSDVTSSGVLRQPVFVRLRDDKRVADCNAPEVHPRVEPVVAAPSAPAADLRLTNLEKVFWPEDGLTKGDLLAYYEAVWTWIAPYLRDRPVVLTRYPDGIAGKSFFQKNAPDFTPSWVETCRIDDTDYFICNELRTLLYVINSGCIPIHVWSARRGALEHPDWAVLDLDPKGAPFAHVVTIAKHVHRLLEALGVPHGVKTSGQAGLHILIPLGGALTHPEARTFSELLARVVAAEQPAIATVARPLSERDGKVYVDYLQNGYGKTIAAPLSVRPLPGAPVSAPLAWSEVNARLTPRRLTIRTELRRLRQHGDPLRATLDAPIDVVATLHALGARLR